MLRDQAPKIVLLQIKPRNDPESRRAAYWGNRRLSFTQLISPMIDYGPEHNLIWITAIDATGEIWCAPNPKVRMQSN